jgi:hypothetical protein
MKANKRSAVIRVITSLIVVIILRSLTVAEAGASATPVNRIASDQSSKAKVLETYGKLPLSFEVNQGQTDGQVKFLSRGSGLHMGVWFGVREPCSRLRRAKPRFAP